MRSAAKVKTFWLWVLTLSVLAITMMVSMTIGAYGIPVSVVAKSAWGYLTLSGFPSSLHSSIDITLYQIRLPRILLVVVVGMALSGSGVALQAIFRNPLSDPFILGISSGAAMGAALSLAFFPDIPVQIAAFVFGLAAVSLALFLSNVGGKTEMISLILAGIVVSSFFSAGLSIVQFMVDPDRLGSIVFWLMGGFSSASWKLVLTVLPMLMAGLIFLLFFSFRLNVLSLDEEEARSLGLSAGYCRMAVIAIASLLTASAVSVCGIIGWVGLIVPHMARFMVGPEHSKLLPFSLLTGGVFLLWTDNLARGITAYEIPIGIITSLLGAPLFMILLKRGKEHWVH